MNGLSKISLEEILDLCRCRWPTEQEPITDKEQRLKTIEWIVCVHGYNKQPEDVA